MPLLLLALVALALTACRALDGPAPAEASPAATPTPAVTVDPSDVASIDAILAAVYDCISGPAGAPRQWARFRGLMHPEGARMMATRQAEDGSESLAVFGVEEYVARVDEPFTSQGFFEREVHRDVRRFGHVAHAFSTYAISRTESGDPIRRGLNSYQLFFDDERWYVVSVLWDDERPDQPLPADFLPAGG